MPRCYAVRLYVIAALLTACGGDAEKLSAEKVGDLSQALKVRQRPDEDRRAQCGDGGATPEGTKALPRHPYLQQVTAGSALIAFRSKTPGVIIDVTRPDGSTVASVEALEDGSAPAGD